MRKYFNLFGVIGFSFLFVLGNVFAQENIKVRETFNFSDLKLVEFNHDIINSNSRINPLWEEYEKLSDEEKTLWSAVPDKYYIEYSVPYNPLENYSFNSLDTTDNLPSKYDLRDVEGNSYVSVMKNQMDLGLCWAFATNTSVETNILKRNLRSSSNPAVFSERHLDYVRSNPKSHVPYNISTAIKPVAEGYNPYHISGKQMGSGGNFATAALYMGYGLTPADATGIWENYVTTHPTLGLSDIFDIEKQSYAVTDYTVYPFVYDFNPYNDTAAQQNNKAEWINMIKKHVIENGSAYVGTAAPQASTSGACYIGDITNKRRVINWNYNCNGNEAKTSNTAGKLAGTHAMSIIGWDDDYELSYCAYAGAANKYGLTGISDSTMTESQCSQVNGTYHTIKGVWILQNSWGKDSDILEEKSYHDYVYLAYDSGINGIGGIVNTIEKDFDNTYNVLGPIFYSEDSSNNSRTEYFFKTGEREYLERISIEVETSSEVSYSISYPGGVTAYVLNVSLPGTYSYTFDEPIPLDSDMFKITVTPRKGDVGAEILGINAFTTNTTDELKAKTVSFYTAPFGDETRHSYGFYTRTINAKSGAEVSYKVKDLKGNDYSQYFVNMKSYIVANAFGDTIYFNNNPLPLNTIYSVETYIDGELAGIDLFDTGLTLEGEGTYEEPYLLETLEDFWYMYTENYSDKYYDLINDIDLSSYENFEPLGINLNKPTVGSLSGNNNYKIIGLKQDGEYGGLFYKLYNIEIYGLNFENVNINASKMGGSIASHAISSRISTVITTGKVETTNPSAYVGGIVGVLYESDIITAINKVDVTGGIAGSLAGYVGPWSYLWDVINIGNIYSEDNINGTISSFFGQIALDHNKMETMIDYSKNNSNNCSSIDQYENDALRIIDVWYYDKSVCEYVGIPLDDEGLRDSSNFINFDEDYWSIVDGKYPTLIDLPMTFVDNVEVTHNLEKNMFVGDTFTLNTVVNPLGATYPELNFSYSNDNFVKNVDGSYTFNSPGPLTISISTTDSTHIQKEFSTYAFSKTFGDKLKDRKYLTIKDEFDIEELENELSFDGVEVELDSIDYLGTGDTIKFMYNNNLVGEFVGIVRGDINGDGIVASSDMLLMRRNILELDELNEVQNIAGDLTGDGISSANILMMRRYILGLEEEL